MHISDFISVEKYRVISSRNILLAHVSKRTSSESTRNDDVRKDTSVYVVEVLASLRRDCETPDIIGINRCTNYLRVLQDATRGRRRLERTMIHRQYRRYVVCPAAILLLRSLANTYQRNCRVADGTLLRIFIERGSESDDGDCYLSIDYGSLTSLLRIRNTLFSLLAPSDALSFPMVLTRSPVALPMSFSTSPMALPRLSRS